MVAFLIMALDKVRARKDAWRIKEITMMVLALLGGATGILLGMVVFRHKINKNKFSVGIPLLLLLNKAVELVIYNLLK